MNSKKFSEAMSELDSRYVDEAMNYPKKEKKPVRFPLRAVAACFAAVIILGAVVFQSGLFGNRTDIATLDNGEQIIFVKTAGGAMSLDMDVTTKLLTEEEAKALFPGMSVTAWAIYSNSTDAGNPQELIGFEGKIGSVKVIISTANVQLRDTVIEGTEKNTEINGITVTAGYFVTDPNSKGEQNAIYYATFEMDGFRVYLENGGTKADSETTKNQLAGVIQGLIENGGFSISSYPWF